MRIENQAEYRNSLLRLRERLTGSEQKPRVLSFVSIEEVDDALRRMDEGTFGICPRCFTLIPTSELMMRPYRIYCSQCKRRKAA